MTAILISLAPFAVAGYLYATSNKEGREVKSTNFDPASDADWIPRNNWVYLENPITMPKSLPGDADQISLERPLGPVQDAMQQQTNPVDSLSILATHEAERDRAIVGLWREFIRPTREIVTRSVNQPITQVNILAPGTTVDKLVPQGNRFYDAPVPRWTGTDTYYPRLVTVPFYNSA